MQRVSLQSLSLCGAMTIFDWDEDNSLDQLLSDSPGFGRMNGICRQSYCTRHFWSLVPVILSQC